jgi:hypothetical protein
MPPLRRTKRAAAAAAESKIKESIAKINQPLDEDEKPKQLSDLNESEEAPPRTQHNKRTATTKRKPGPSKHTNAIHRTTKKSKKSSKTDQESQVHPSPSEASYPDLFSENNSAASDMDCGLSFSSTSTSGASTTVPSSVTTVDREALEHQRRRAARMVNSNRPMLLSRRTSYKMARRVPSEFASPVYSPIHANRISFTPVAKLTTSTIPLLRRGHRAML